MKEYIGIRIVKAEPAVRFKDAIGNVRDELAVALPLPRPGETPQIGYKVVFSNGAEAFTPAALFEQMYRPVTGMSFGMALEALKIGCLVAREGWNGKNQHIELASNIAYKNVVGTVVNCNHEAIGNQAIAFVGTSGVQMGWLASQADMLAEDWYII